MFKILSFFKKHGILGITVFFLVNIIPYMKAIVVYYKYCLLNNKKKHSKYLVLGPDAPKNLLLLSCTLRIPFKYVYIGNPSLKFQKHIKSIFQKYNKKIIPACTSRKISNYFNTKANAWKLSMQMSSINILVLKIRISPTWEWHPDNFSGKSKTTKDLTKKA